MALFLLGCLVLLRFMTFAPSPVDETGVFGGPVAEAAKNTFPERGLAILESNVPPAVGEFAQDKFAIADPDTASLSGPQGIVVDAANQGGIVYYKVQPGDNLDRIANQFGVSLDTILGANPNILAASLRAGEKLSILPVSGTIYRVKDGETAESIALTYGLNISQLREFNPAVNLADLNLGDSLILPGVKAAVVSATNSSLRDLRDYFIMPAEGYNWGKIHNYNAVDIANACGTSVLAAAEGLVTDYGDSPYFNGGYGGYVLIEHPNGTKTRYAHLGELSVRLGDYVKQGQKVGEMGATGNVHGPTGCHLHFEVYGAKNPFART